MNIKILLSVLFTLNTFFAISQEQYHSILILDPDLKTNANAVVRLSEIEVTILSSDKLLFKNRRIVTILNSSGNSKLGAVYYYDSNKNLKTLEARIYNAFGAEIKKIKKKDFKDVVAVDGVSLYSDNRVKYLDYTPTGYPYTMEFLEEYETSFTVGIPGWYPLEDYNLSVEKSHYKLLNPNNLGIAVKTKNFEAYNVEILSEGNYQVRNIKAIKREDYSPSFQDIMPYLKATMKQFNMEGYEGVNTGWVDFGKWMNDKLLEDTRALPQSTVKEINALTANAKTDIEKARIVYDYVQNKTRYISVQIGIGGWRPMLASDVDRLGYGDCKGLTNYTKALLDAIGVKSYYTVIYGDRDLRNIDASFSSLQGNHVILSLPTDDDYIWLECTSQTNPFGHIANFTDDRDALVITPEGGKIEHTRVYQTEENLLETKALVQMDEEGGFQAQVTMASKGTQYDFHERILRADSKNQDLHYKDYWDYLNTLKIHDYTFQNDKENVVFQEDVKLSSTKYASKAGDRLLVNVNFFNRVTDGPDKYANRKLPFEVSRGFVDSDTYTIQIPEGLEIEAVMDPVEISNPFGTYTASVEQKGGELVYQRKFQLNKGYYPKEDYKAFREFWLKVIKHDNSKIVLKTKS